LNLFVIIKKSYTWLWFGCTCEIVKSGTINCSKRTLRLWKKPNLED